MAHRAAFIMSKLPLTVLSEIKRLEREAVIPV
jgi:hypothetical protein